VPRKFLYPQRDQPLLLPVDMREWLPEDDLVFVVLDAVATLDLGESAAGTGPTVMAGRRLTGDDGGAAVWVLPGRAVQPGD
jgi:hypothetical protein